MKKTLSMLFALTIALSGMTMTQAATTAQSTIPVNGTLLRAGEKASASQKIVWEHAGDLPAQKGSKVNIGTAGLLSGYSNGYIVFGGGANFPDGSPAVGGPKVQYPDIYIMKDYNGQLRTVNHTALPYEIGYGTSITTDEGIYYVGGSPVEAEANNIILLKVDKNGNLTTKKIGELPFTYSDGVAVKKGNKLYIGAGKQDGKATNKFWEFDLSTGKTKELAAVPGEDTRTQVVAQVLNGYVCVFSGGDAVAYTDGYRYDTAKNTWTKIADVSVGGQKISLLGANSVKLNENEMLVIGGFNKEVYDNAVATMAELKDDALQNFKNGYFSADSHTFNWNKKVLVYNVQSNEWRSIGEVPFDAPCGEGLVLNGSKIYSANGEIKPGTRSNRTYSGTLVNF